MIPRWAGVKAASKKSSFIHARRSLSAHVTSWKGTWLYWRPSRTSALSSRSRSSKRSNTIHRIGSGPLEESPSCSKEPKETTSPLAARR